MTYIVFTQPHALDAIWSQAVEVFHNAGVAMDDLGGDFTNEELDTVANDFAAAVQVIMALPARHLSDSLFKLDCAGIDGPDGIRPDCDATAIMNEANKLLDAAIARGTKLKKVMPDFLEGVTL